MGTLVQAPERADSTVGGLQAIAKPAKGGGLGSFLESLLPAVNAEVDKYQEENRDRVVALGRNDKINSMYRDVSLLDRKAYAQGREYQNTVNGQIALAKDFQSKVDAIERTDPNPDKLLGLVDAYSNDSVDNIHLSKLPTAMKKQLYETQLKANAAYVSMVDKKLKRITADNVAITRQNSVAMVVNDLSFQELDPEEGVALLVSHRERSAEGMRLVDPEVSVEDIDAAFQAEAMAIFDNVLSTLEAGEDGAENIARMENLAEVAVRTQGISLKTSTAINKRVMSFKAEAIAIVDTQVEREVNDFITQVRLDPASISTEQFSELGGKIADLENLSPTAKTAMLNKLNNAFVGQHESLSSGQSLYDPTGITVGDAERMGVSGSTLVSEALQKRHQENGANTGLTGLQLIQQFGLGAEYYGEGVRKGAEILTRNFIGYTKFTPEQVQADKFYDMRNEHFDTFSKLYRTAEQGNGASASDLLDGIPSELRNAFITTMLEGGTLEDVRAKANSPIATAASYDNLKKARDGMTADMFGLGGNPIMDTATGRRSMSKKLHPNFMDKVNIATEESFPQLILQQNSSVPQETAAIMSAVFLTSDKYKYSPAVMNINTSKLIDNIKVDGGAKLGRQYVATADAAKRGEFATKYGVSADDIIVSFSNNGLTATYEMYDTTTKDRFGLRDGEGRRTAVEEVSLARLVSAAKLLHKADATRNPTPKQRVEQENNRVITSGVFKDLVSGQPTKVKLTVPFTKMTGGNPDVASMVTGHLADWYGFTATPVNVVDGTRAYGVAGSSKFVSADLAKRFEAASGDVDATMRVQGDLFTQRMRGVQTDKAFKMVGSTVPNKNLYPEKDKAAATLIYSAGYLEGNAGLYGNGKDKVGVVNAMQARTYKEAEALFKKSLLYDATGKQKQRNAMYLGALKAHFKSQGKL